MYPSFRARRASLTRALAAICMSALVLSVALISAMEAHAASSPSNRATAAGVHAVSAKKLASVRRSASTACGRDGASVVCKRARRSMRLCRTGRRAACRRSVGRLRQAQRAARAVESRRRAADLRVAPVLTVRGQTVEWARIGTVDSYVLATGVPGQATTYRTVTGLSDTPPVVDGQTVTYALRTNVSGSNWSPQVKIAYPATVTATSTTDSTVSGASVNTSIKGDTGFLESAFSFNPGALFFGGFEASPWTNTFKPSGWNRQSNVSVVSGTSAFQRNAISVKYPKGSYSTSSVGSGGTEFRSHFDSTGLGIGNQDVAYLRYMIKFQDGFQFAKGGKLPGLCGGTCMGNQAGPDGTDNWNGRLMWTAGGKVNFYMYHYGMTTSYGTYYPWSQGGTQRAFTPGKWHCVEMGYKMNTPGQKDGALMAWFDGEPAYSNTAFQYRTTTNLKVDKLWFNTFFGGSTSDWASPQDQSTSFDNVAIAKTRIGCDTAL